MARDILSVWAAAVEVTAFAYKVDPAPISAPSRGRGPRPPVEVWEAKKMAVHLTCIVSAANYAAVGRALGLHRDTVASHCAEMRDTVLMVDRDEVMAAALEPLVRMRVGERAREKIDALRAHIRMLEAAVADLTPISSDRHPTNHPTLFADHENVIPLILTVRGA